MKVLHDFADVEQAGRFPRHGWAENSQGIKLLWIPILRLLGSVHRIRDERGVSSLEARYSLYMAPFTKTTRKLATTLRELHELVRKSPGPFSLHQTSEDWRQFKREHDMLPLYIDFAFVYLRTLADQLAIASRPVLFANHKSVPTTFKTLRDFVNDEERVELAVPICDPHLLASALANHSSWFDSLRQTVPEKGKPKKGIRDAILHRPATVEILYTGEGRLAPFLFSPSDDVDCGTQLLAALRDMLAELCDLWTGIHTAVGWGERYESAAHLPLTGTDDDIVGFWPEI